MRKYWIFLFSFFYISVSAAEEGMHVVSFKQDLSDLSARTNQKLDINDEPCALVKVQVLTEDLISFKESMVVGGVEKHVNEYWAYLTHGAK